MIRCTRSSETIPTHVLRRSERVEVCAGERQRGDDRGACGAGSRRARMRSACSGSPMHHAALDSAPTRPASERAAETEAATATQARAQSAAICQSPSVARRSRRSRRSSRAARTGRSAGAAAAARPTSSGRSAARRGRRARELEEHDEQRARRRSRWPACGRWGRAEHEREGDERRRRCRTGRAGAGAATLAARGRAGRARRAPGPRREGTPETDQLRDREQPLGDRWSPRRPVRGWSGWLRGAASLLVWCPGPLRVGRLLTNARGDRSAAAAEAGPNLRRTGLGPQIARSPRGVGQETAHIEVGRSTTRAMTPATSV